MLSHGMRYSVDQLEAMIAQVDTNKNGTVDFDEFVDLFLGHDDVDDHEEMVDAFRLIFG